MILVGQYDSPFVRRVAVTLHHYHMPFERNTISVFSQAKKMQKINPLIRIPCLELASGEILIDSWAILDYLDQLAGPARALTPSNGPERRKILQGDCNAAHKRRVILANKDHGLTIAQLRETVHNLLAPHQW